MLVSAQVRAVFLPCAHLCETHVRNLGNTHDRTTHRHFSEHEHFRARYLVIWMA